MNEMQCQTLATATISIYAFEMKHIFASTYFQIILLGNGLKYIIVLSVGQKIMKPVDFDVSTNPCR